MVRPMRTLLSICFTAPVAGSMSALRRTDHRVVLEPAGNLSFMLPDWSTRRTTVGVLPSKPTVRLTQPSPWKPPPPPAEPPAPVVTMVPGGAQTPDDMQAVPEGQGCESLHAAAQVVPLQRKPTGH